MVLFRSLNWLSRSIRLHQLQLSAAESSLAAAGRDRAQDAERRTSNARAPNGGQLRFRSLCNKERSILGSFLAPPLLSNFQINCCGKKARTTRAKRCRGRGGEGCPGKALLPSWLEAAGRLLV